MPSNYYETYGRVALTDATVTITDEGYLGKPLVFDRAAGVIATLPAATGSGNAYKFYVATTVTSNNYIVKVANANDTMVGSAILLQDGGDTSVAFEASGTTDTVTFNGTTTGGVAGARIELIDIKTNLWHVVVRSAATGTEATPFSATVS